MSARRRSARCFPPSGWNAWTRRAWEKAIIYPSLGLLWEAENLDDLELQAAYARAYNRWVEDFCPGLERPSDSIAHISMGDPRRPAREIERAVKNGAKGAFFVPFTPTNKSHAHPDYDPFWAKAQELTCRSAFIPAASRRPSGSINASGTCRSGRCGTTTVHGAQGPLQAFTALFQYGLFERFPRVKVVVLESGAGWAGYLLNRMDAVYEQPAGRIRAAQGEAQLLFSPPVLDLGRSRRKGVWQRR